MRQSLKIAISLLISVLLFSAFAVLAFTNLFSLIDTGFFQPRVRAQKFDSLATAAASVGRYHDLNVERFALVAGSPGAAAQLLRGARENGEPGARRGARRPRRAGSRPSNRPHRRPRRAT